MPLFSFLPFWSTRCLFSVQPSFFLFCFSTSFLLFLHFSATFSCLLFQPLSFFCSAPLSFVSLDVLPYFFSPKLFSLQPKTFFFSLKPFSVQPKNIFFSSAHTTVSASFSFCWLCFQRLLLFFFSSCLSFLPLATTYFPFSAQVFSSKPFSAASCLFI